MNGNDVISHCGGAIIAIKECHNQNEVYNDKMVLVQWINLYNQNKIYQWLLPQTTVS